MFTNEELIKQYKVLSKQQNDILTELKERKVNWKFLAENGMTVPAIMIYRQENNCSLKEAHQIVNDHILELKVRLMMDLKD